MYLTELLYDIIYDTYHTYHTSTRILRSTIVAVCRLLYTCYKFINGIIYEGVFLLVDGGPLTFGL